RRGGRACCAWAASGVEFVARAGGAARADGIMVADCRAARPARRRQSAAARIPLAAARRRPHNQRSFPASPSGSLRALFGIAQPTQFDLHWRMFGIDVRVHPLFWLFSAVLGWGFTGGRLDSLVVWVVVVFVSVLVHELGHVLTGRIFGSS